MTTISARPDLPIAKLATDASAYQRVVLPFETARAAFAAFLEGVLGRGGGRVLLPAYIGWSPREGSGVFDPVRALELSYAFYRVDGQLNLDIDHLEALLRTGDVAVVVLIHYFGRPDPRAAEAARLARAYGALVLEDEAHALYTDLVGGVSGRLGDAAVFSFHKMLPVESGGALVINPGAHARVAAVAVGRDASAVALPDIWKYDLAAIAARRTANSAALEVALAPRGDDVEPLWTELPQGTVLQTYPIRIRRGSRDALYHAMNAAGYGVVSLYHTLIAEISTAEFPESHELARTLLNLPVHQDALPAGLTALASELRRRLGAELVGTVRT